jgi:hypothetical protein
MTNIGQLVTRLAVEAGSRFIGSGLRTTLAELSEAEWLPARDLRERSELKLARIASHAARAAGTHLI